MPFLNASSAREQLDAIERAVEWTPGFLKENIDGELGFRMSESFTVIEAWRAQFEHEGYSPSWIEAALEGETSALAARLQAADPLLEFRPDLARRAALRELSRPVQDARALWYPEIGAGG